MNKCANCGHEFEGKFCPECGAKFVDKDACPNCGAKHAPEAKFCSECGARLDGKVVCPKCGAVSDGKAVFCAECGSPLDGSKTEKSGGSVVTKEKVKTVVYLSGIICILISALMGLVFSFVCGVSAKSDAGSSESFMLYEYFGKAYEDLDTLKQSIQNAFNWASMGEAREFALYFPVVLGTVISAVGLLGVVALSALTVYKVYKKFYKKQKTNIVAPAVATYLTFATLATLLLLLNAARSGDTKTVFSAPTLAGLITGGIFCGLGLLLIACSRPEAFKGSAVVGSIIAVAASALTVVVIALMALPTAGMSISNTGILSSADVSFGMFTGMQSALLIAKDDETIYSLIAYSTIAGSVAIALAVISAVTLFRKLPAACHGKNKSNIILGAVAVVLSAVYLAFTVLFMEMMPEAYGNTVSADANFSYNYAVPIAVLVLTVLALVAEVAGKILVKDKAE